jgi:hypothetical protein
MMLLIQAISRNTYFAIQSKKLIILASIYTYWYVGGIHVLIIGKFNSMYSWYWFVVTWPYDVLQQWYRVSITQSQCLPGDWGHKEDVRQ